MGGAALGCCDLCYCLLPAFSYGAECNCAVIMAHACGIGFELYFHRFVSVLKRQVIVWLVVALLPVVHNFRVVHGDGFHAPWRAAVEFDVVHIYIE